MASLDADGRRAILRTRLFGYAVLFRAREVSSAAYEPVHVTETAAAEALARELELHVGQSVEPGISVSGEVGISVPFGRCGLSGRPLEHVRVHHAEQAWVDTLSLDGPSTREVAEGETILVEPGSIVRFRGRPRPGGRVLVSFQTEDRSPLAGHAAPLTLAGQDVPADPGPRLACTTAAFESLCRDLTGARSRLDGLFSEMASVVGDTPEVARAQDLAATAGSYEAGGLPALFDDARAMLTPAVISRIRGADDPLFRFPGMFGAVAPLFPLLDP